MQKINNNIKNVGIFLIILGILFNPFFIGLLSKVFINIEWNILFYSFVVLFEFLIIIFGIYSIKDPERVRKNLSSIILSIIVSMVCLVILIMILSMLKPNTIHTQYSKEFHHMYAPNDSGWRYPDPGDKYEKVWIETNSLGMRGPEITKKGHKKRILIIGDSFIHADEVVWEKTIGEILQNKLGHNYSVIQQGYSSWSPLLELNFIKKNYEDLQPDHVYLVLLKNDFYDSDVFSSSDTGYSKITNFDESDYPIDFDVNIPSPIKNKILTSNVLKLFILTFKKKESPCSDYLSQQDIDHLFEIEENYTKKYALNKLNNLKFVENMVRLARKPEYWDEKTTKTVEDTFSNVIKLNNYLKEKDCNLTVLITPLGWNIDKKESVIGKISDYYCFEEDVVYTDEGIRDKIRSLSKENGIDYLEIREIMVNYKKNNPDKNLFFDFDGHWNNRGHELMANILYYDLIR